MMLSEDDVVLGGGHYTCDKCGDTVFGSSLHYCTVDTHKCFYCNSVIKDKEVHDIITVFAIEYWVCQSCERDKKLEKVLDENISK